jgi:hypothetical protein
MRSLLLLTALVLMPAAAAAQGNPADAKVDCSLFSKKPNGAWFVNAQATIELGDSQITIAAGDLGPRMMQFGMVDLQTVLENACPEKSGAPAPERPTRLR